MSACVVWIDSEQAKIFKIEASGVKKTEIKKHGMKHSNSHQDAHFEHQEAHFFHEVAETIQPVQELLVFGPGVAKNHFKSHLENHKHIELFKHLVGVESLDHLSDNQILEASRKFFKKFNQFNSTL